jgi:hypothetical protein
MEIKSLLHGSIWEGAAFTAKNSIRRVFTGSPCGRCRVHNRENY